MTTLIALYKHRRCAGRCDANCYNAVGPKCNCICGGINHGKGKALALEQTRAALGGLQKLHREAHDYHASQRLIFPLAVRQHTFLSQIKQPDEANRTETVPVARMEHPG